MTKAIIAKYQSWGEYFARTLIGLSVSASILLGVHYVEAQSIHKRQSDDIKALQSDSKNIIVIPESIKLNEYKISQCNKSIDEVKKDVKENRNETREYRITQNENINKILTLLIEIKSKK